MSREAVRHETLNRVPADGLAATLGTTWADTPGEEQELPLLWHWLYLLDRPDVTALGPDGHRLRGSDPDGLDARLFAGGRVRQHRPLMTGRPATVTESVVRETRKQTRSGLIRFVTERYEYSQDGQLCIEDERDLAYLHPASRGAPSTESDGSSAGHWLLRLDTDPVLLFRFSALTFNSHRIHYDDHYARQVEGLGGLLVHGPLQAVAMVESVRTVLGRSPRQVEFRLVAPLHAGEGLNVIRNGGEDAPGATSVEVRTDDGRLTARAVVSIE